MRTLKSNYYCKRTLILLFAVFISLAVSVAECRSGIVLGEDYPYADTFMQMARRGVADFVAERGEFNSDLAELEDQGFTAFMFPGGFSPSYYYDDEQAVISANGRPLYGCGVLGEPFDYTINRPQPGLYSYIEWYAPSPDNPDVREMQSLKTWHFRGAEWLDAGYSQAEISSALQLDRITTHLIWVSMNYQYDNAGYMPGDLVDLEEYVGTARNPRCWEGVQEVCSYSEVEWNPGNLFVGWVDGDWVISCHLGPEILTERFTESDSGMWVMTEQSSLIY